MSVRVLLFTQTGDARPKCSPGSQEALRYLAGCPQRTQDVTLAPLRADRWWLVECENADAGRALIADALYRPSDVLASEAWAWVRKLPSTGRPHGRILASGGRP